MKLYMFRAVPLPETCRISCRSKIEKLVHLVGFVIRGKKAHNTFRLENYEIPSYTRTNTTTVKLTEDIKYCPKQNKTVFDNDNILSNCNQEMLGVGAEYNRICYHIYRAFKAAVISDMFSVNKEVS
jgi:hypothetical protein